MEVCREEQGSDVGDMKEKYICVCVLNGEGLEVDGTRHDIEGVNRTNRSIWGGARFIKLWKELSEDSN